MKFRPYEVVCSKEDMFDVLCGLGRKRDPREVMEAAAKKYGCSQPEARFQVVAAVKDRAPKIDGERPADRALRLIAAGKAVMAELDESDRDDRLLRMVRGIEQRIP